MKNKTDKATALRCEAIVRLETGQHYWWMQKHELIWRVCYVGEDCDEAQWLHLVGMEPLEVAKMDLSCLEWVKLTPPNIHSSATPNHGH